MSESSTPCSFTKCRPRAVGGPFLSATKGLNRPGGGSARGTAVRTCRRGDLSVVMFALLPKAAGPVLDRFAELDGLVAVEAHSCVRESRRPDCSTVSRRMHSRTCADWLKCPRGTPGGGEDDGATVLL